MEAASRIAFITDLDRLPALVTLVTPSPAILIVVTRLTTVPLLMAGAIKFVLTMDLACRIAVAMLDMYGPGRIACQSTTAKVETTIAPITAYMTGRECSTVNVMRDMTQRGLIVQL